MWNINLLSKVQKTSSHLLILSEHLKSSSAEYIFHWLQKNIYPEYVCYSIQTVFSCYSEVVSEDCERALFARGERLIDLGLAMYGYYVVEPLYTRAKALKDRVLLDACLSNYRDLSWLSPENLGELKDSNREMEILLVNLRFLVLCACKQELWQSISQRQQIQVLKALNKKRKSKSGDFLVSMFSSVYDQLWRISEIVPLSKEFARALAEMYTWLPADNCPFEGRTKFSCEEASRIIKRWHINTADTPKIVDVTKEKRSLTKCTLTPYEGVRVGLYRVILRNDEKEVDFEHEDIAYRAALYEHASIFTAKMKLALEKDGMIAAKYLAKNWRIWRDSESRKILKKNNRRVYYEAFIAKYCKIDEESEEKIESWVLKEYCSESFASYINSQKYQLSNTAIRLMNDFESSQYFHFRKTAYLRLCNSRYQKKLLKMLFTQENTLNKLNKNDRLLRALLIGLFIYFFTDILIKVSR